MRLLKIIFTVYVEIFRDTPMIVQAMIVYYGIKMLGVEMTPVFAGIVVTVLNTGAYMGETVRAGIGSIDMGQREGAWAMGMSPFKTMLYVVLPQACNCSTGTFHGCKNSRRKLLQILRVIPGNCSDLLCIVLCL